MLEIEFKIFSREGERAANNGCNGSHIRRGQPPGPGTAVTDLKGMIVLGLFSLSYRLNTRARPVSSVSTLNQFTTRDKESEL